MAHGHNHEAARVRFFLPLALPLRVDTSDAVRAGFVQPLPGLPGVAWLHQVLNLSEAAVFMQTGQSELAREVALPPFHFNLHVTTVFAPILLRAACDGPLVAAQASAQHKPHPRAPGAAPETTGRTGHSGLAQYTI